MRRDITESEQSSGASLRRHGELSSLVVAGLVWLMRRNGPQDEVLAGPAIGAALGVHMLGAQPELLVAVPASLPKPALRLIEALDTSRRLWRHRHVPPLRWSCNSIRGDASRGALQGDARGWIATCDPDCLRDRILVLANGNPSAYVDLLENGRPRFAAIDVDASWAPSQQAALNKCLRLVQLATITRHDYEKLPSRVLAGTKLGQREGGVLIIKSGADGVTLLADGKSQAMPPPVIDDQLNTDIGAGDLLLGLLATRLGLASQPTLIHEVEFAYREVLPVVGRLLQSDGFAEFADAIMETQIAF
jgi:hypothetical protein